VDPATTLNRVVFEKPAGPRGSYRHRMEKIESKDGTAIAFDQLGGGPRLILVAGASCDRAVGAPLAEALARHFTVLNYDRRGRGDSGDTVPYAVAREVEDLAALLDAAGGSARVLGLSSGAALAAEAAASGLPIDRLIMWEPPFSVDPDGPRRAKLYTDRLTELLAADRRGDALAHFMAQVGLPDEAIAGMRQSPYWKLGLSLAPTLAYDAAILGDTTVPTRRYREIGVPTLVLSGSKSPDFLRRAAERVAEAIPGARHDELMGQDHNVAGDSIAPVVAAFAGR
jgi:pimeloyl-ACP methyl ester carboxylesterase